MALRRRRVYKFPLRRKGTTAAALDYAVESQPTQLKAFSFSIVSQTCPSDIKSRTQLKVYVATQWLKLHSIGEHLHKVWNVPVLCASLTPDQQHSPQT
eukprot:3504132-Amphidinium_carterae.2